MEEATYDYEFSIHSMRPSIHIQELFKLINSRFVLENWTAKQFRDFREGVTRVGIELVEISRRLHTPTETVL